MAAAGGKPGIATAVNSGYGSQIEGKKATYWKKNSSRVPGSIKPVYSAKYPMDVVQQQPQGRGSPSKSGKHKKDSFADFDSSTCDAWEVNDDEFLSMTSRKLSIETPSIEGQVDPTGVQRSNAHLQRSSGNKDTVKATIKDTHIQQGDVPLQNRNTEPHSPGRPQRIDTSPPASPTSPTSPTHPSSEFFSQAAPVPGMMEAPRPSSPIRLPTMPVPDRQDGKLTKFEKVLAASNMEMEVLRKLSWAGIPKTVRPTAWKVLSGYLPANIERRQATLDRKREEYFGFVDQYYETRHDAQHKNMFHQIHIDIPRTNPLIPLFQESNVQEIFERILYIWALKHPASGYVQGINDLVTPFFVVFLSEHVGGEDIENIEKYKGIKKLPQETLREIEADSFWCMSKLLDGIQDNYTFAQPGIQLKVAQLKELIQRINAPLHRHLMENQLDYLQFAFRWMNNILMREFPLSCTVRLWDTYMSEPEGFAVFHLYVCAALLQMFAGKIMRERDFQGTMLFLQNLPTHNWGNKDISLLVAEAYKLKYMFADAPRHLNQQAKR